MIRMIEEETQLSTTVIRVRFWGLSGATGGHLNRKGIKAVDER